MFFCVVVLCHNIYKHSLLDVFSSTNPHDFSFGSWSGIFLICQCSSVLCTFGLQPSTARVDQVILKAKEAVSSCVCLGLCDTDRDSDLLCCCDKRQLLSSQRSASTFRHTFIRLLRVRRRSVTVTPAAMATILKHTPHPGCKQREAWWVIWLHLNVFPAGLFCPWTIFTSS